MCVLIIQNNNIIKKKEMTRSNSILKMNDNKTTETQSGSSTSSTTTKSVSFQPTVQVYKTLHINDYTERQIKATWWSSSEQQKLKSRAVNIVRTMESSSRFHETETFCTRGLEYFTVAGQERRKRRRREAWDAVSRTQDWIAHYQQNLVADDGEVDYEQILADVYAEYTMESQRIARVVGMADEHFVISSGCTIPDEKRVTSSASSNCTSHPTRIALLHGSCRTRRERLEQCNYISHAA
jgi:hypothetical protein